MSSVLKALRDQSSPLLQQPAPIWLSSAPSRQPLRWWWVAIVALLVLMVTSLYSWLSRPSAPTIAVEASHLPAIPTVRYELGRSTDIKVPAWNTAPVDRPVTQQAERPSQAVQGQGIDLKQVSPELLAAFEQAVAAQQSGQPATMQATSVLPSITALTVDLQRQIPSFSYDSHQYSSRDSARNVTFSGQRLVEGDVWQGLTIMRITPTHVVLSRNQAAFQQPALEDWTRP